jgi:hypothetical protein
MLRNAPVRVGASFETRLKALLRMRAEGFFRHPSLLHRLFLFFSTAPVLPDHTG